MNVLPSYIVKEDYIQYHYRVQNQVSGVINTMKDNINKVLDRGDKLEDLEEKSGMYVCTMVKKVNVHGSKIGELAESALQFRTSSRRLERKMWWKNCRVRFNMFTTCIFHCFFS